MNVDKARFLLLTTALSAATAVASAASGCSSTSDAKDGGTTTTTPTPEAGGTDASTADASTADANACLDDTGLAPTCQGSSSDVTCASTCNALTAHYKMGVARAIGDCIMQLPACEGAINQIDSCVQSALEKACPDPTAEGYCTPLSMACADDGAATTLTQADCLNVARALTTQGRTSFEACVHGNSADADVNYCVAAPLGCTPP